MAVLRLKKGPLPGTPFPIFSTRKPNIIGRDANVEVCIQDQRASRRHAAIFLDRGRWLVEDLDSSNGTGLQGRRISRAPIADGMVLQVGSHVFTFHENELVLPPAGELHGTRLLEAVREEAGAFVCRGYQGVMDREVRVDWLHPHRSDTAVLERLTRAFEEARELSGDGIRPLLRAAVNASMGPCDRPESTYAILQGAIGPTVEAESGQILMWDVATRISLFRQIAKGVLERASCPLLRYPIGLANIVVSAEAGPLQLSVPALDLGPCLAHVGGDAIHLPGLAPYLAPELRHGPPADELRALTYNLGAIGCHLLTGHAPGDVDHDRVPAALLETGVPSVLRSLIERMLDKDPARRPPADRRLLEEIAASTPTGSPSRSAAAGNADEDDVLAELDDDALLEEHRPDDAPRRGPPGDVRPPPERSRRPARAIHRRRTAKRPSGLRRLAFWILVWIGLFFAARHLARIAFEEFGW